MNQPQHQTPRKPVSISTSLSDPRFSRTAEIECEYCGGSGRDPGTLDHILEGEPPICPSCQGRSTEIVTRNFLSEAFAIAQNADSTRVVEREHLVAVIQFAREHVSALYQLPEVA